MKALIVDDDFVSRKKLQKILSGFGECDVAVNGSEAIDAFKLAHHNNKPYDLITMDIVMPDMDGHEAAQKIREYEDEKFLNSGKGIKTVKMIMVSKINDPKDIMSSFLKDNCDGYITKPFNKENIVVQLEKNGLV